MPLRQMLMQTMSISMARPQSSNGILHCLDVFHSPLFESTPTRTNNEVALDPMQRLDEDASLESRLHQGQGAWVALAGLGEDHPKKKPRQ